jgi:hypothetical protein
MSWLSDCFLDKEEVNIGRMVVFEMGWESGFMARLVKCFLGSLEMLISLIFFFLCCVDEVFIDWVEQFFLGWLVVGFMDKMEEMFTDWLELEFNT